MKNINSILRGAFTKLAEGSRGLTMHNPTYYINKYVFQNWCVELKVEPTGLGIWNGIDIVPKASQPPTKITLEYEHADGFKMYRSQTFYFEDRCDCGADDLKLPGHKTNCPKWSEW